MPEYSNVQDRMDDKRKCNQGAVNEVGLVRSKRSGAINLAVYKQEDVL